MWSRCIPAGVCVYVFVIITLIEGSVSSEAATALLTAVVAIHHNLHHNMHHNNPNLHHRQTVIIMSTLFTQSQGLAYSVHWAIFLCVHN